MSQPLELFNQGELFAAIEAAIEEVREQPDDVDCRWLLATLFCFEGDLERAEKHLQTILRQAPDLAAEVLLHRNLLRGELMRRQVFAEGRMPGFTETPSERLQAVLKALTLLHDKKDEQAAEVLREVNTPASEVAGKCNGEPFSQIRDRDDVTATFLEIITTNGDYYWVPFEDLHDVSLTPVEDARDVIWRPATLTNREHESHTAYIPGLYVHSYQSTDASVQNGRAAEWEESPAGILVGSGLRCFDFDADKSKHFLEIERLQFS